MVEIADTLVFTHGIEDIDVGIERFEELTESIENTECVFDLYGIYCIGKGLYEQTGWSRRYQYTDEGAAGTLYEIYDTTDSVNEFFNGENAANPNVNQRGRFYNRVANSRLRPVLRLTEDFTPKWCTLLDEKCDRIAKRRGTISSGGAPRTSSPGRVSRYVTKAKTYVNNKVITPVETKIIAPIKTKIIAPIKNSSYLKTIASWSRSAGNVCKYAAIVAEGIDIVDTFINEGFEAGAKKSVIAASGLTCACVGTKVGAAIGAPFFPPIGAVVGGAVGGIIGYIAGSGIGSVICKAGKAAFEGVKKVGKAVYNGAKKVVNTVVDGAKKVGKAIVNFFSSIF